MNLLKETRNAIWEAGKRIRDIAWIGSLDGEYAISWEKFRKIADREYYNGFGAQKIASDLVVVFKDGSWLERLEYDGAEHWVYKRTPVRKEKPKTIKSVFVEDTGAIGWRTVKEINEEVNNGQN